ncbi:u6 snrna-specific terminal uridylyltransferase 1 [Lasius niger]|uniref:U6 snrna-specific terminal uridylyltransferase 1 n=1 Tax=Lasius niger TaxID=67767 RepID=A0A0J7KUC4_LASNI|nr:u6 snrna-specific terminal uridylyltransferase 1 [Lasius niger]
MIFKLQVEILLDQETKQQKVEVLSDVHTRSHQKITFHCTGNKCVWYNRKKNNRTLLDVQLSLLEKEAIMSDKVMEQLNDEANNIKLDFICTLEKVDNPVALDTKNNRENIATYVTVQKDLQPIAVPQETVMVLCMYVYTSHTPFGIYGPKNLQYFV